MQKTDAAQPRTHTNEIEHRRSAVESTLGSLRIEGLEIDAEGRAIIDRYIDGDIGIDDVVAVLTKYPY